MTQERGSVTIRQIVEALNAGQPEAARQACRSLLVEAENDPALNQLAAMAALRTGRAEEVDVFARRSLAARPDHGPTLILAGRAARLLGRPAEAVTVLGQAAARAPDLAEAAFQLCAARLEAGEPPEALDRDVSGSNRSGDMNVIDSNKMEHDVVRKAMPAFRHHALGLEDLAARFPGEVAGWEEVAEVLVKAGQPAAALFCLEAAARSRPSFALAMRRGMLARDAGHSDKARAAFAEATARDPGCARAWFLLGVATQDGGDGAASAKAYRQALALDPGLAEAAVNLGTVLQSARDLEGAKAAYAQAVQIRPDTFGRIAQAMTSSSQGELWLDLGALRRALAG